MSKESKEELDAKYNHRELPKVKNWFSYTYRAFMKLFFYVYSGIGSVFLALFVFPWIRVFVHPKDQFKIAARRFVSASFRGFINFMQFTGTVDVKVVTAKSSKTFTEK